MPNYKMINSQIDDLVYVRYKFKYEDTVIFKLVSRAEFEELKDVFTIEFCDLMNWIFERIIDAIYS